MTASPAAPVSAPPTVGKGTGKPAGPATGDDRSLGELVKAASAQVSGLIHAEIELAKSELKVDVKAALAGVVAVAVAAVFGFFLVVMLLIAGAEGIVALGLPRWSAYLIMAGLLLVLAGIVAVIGIGAFKKISPPKKTIDSAKNTVAMVKSRPHEQKRPGSPTL